MRAAAVDYRTRVRFSWEGAAGGSESRAVLDGNVLVRNLAKNPMCSFNNYFFSNDTKVATVSRNQPVPAPHPLGISTCASSVALQGSNMLTMYNIDGMGNTASQRWLSAWVWSPVDAIASINHTPVFPVPANTWTFISSNSVSGFSGATVSLPAGQSAVGLVAYITGVTTVLSPEIPPCFSGASKDIDRIRIADWYAGLTDDQRLDSIAGPVSAW